MECHDCKSEKTLKTCSVHNPKHAKICKDCCIREMNGHKCKWWELCWI